MMINAQQKAQFEQRAVMGLGLLFVLVLLMGPAKRFIGPAPAARPKPPTPGPAAAEQGTLPNIIDRYHERLEATADMAAPAPKLSERPAAGYSAQALRDPMKSLLPVAAKAAVAQAAARVAQAAARPKPPAPPPALRLQGIIWGDGVPQVLIDGRYYAVGERVGHHKILTIDREGITVEHEGQPVAFRMPQVAETGPRARVR